MSKTACRLGQIGATLLREGQRLAPGTQKQLGHASAEMNRKYQRRRDRFRTNLTRASGL
ncbi:hypothetical protein [Paramesorhizobium deserti]|uniref:hypothetical protein n=1 Tax=Paramesorhizobium deserti TaxID=1494590 RepID=UPI0019103973|nr:hypothetical protein [Paramesorhizobium deserti]